MKNMIPVVILIALMSCGTSPTEPTALAVNPSPTVTYIPTTVSPMAPHLSIVGGCDPWNPWSPLWVVNNTGGPTASLNDYWNKTGWIYYTVAVVGQTNPIEQNHGSFNMAANSSTNIGSFLYGPENPHYTLTLTYLGASISNTVDCSHYTVTPIPTYAPTPYPTPVPTPSHTPVPTVKPTCGGPGPGGGC